MSELFFLRKAVLERLTSGATLDQLRLNTRAVTFLDLLEIISSAEEKANKSLLNDLECQKADQLI